MTDGRTDGRARLLGGYAPPGGSPRGGDRARGHVSGTGSQPRQFMVCLKDVTQIEIGWRKVSSAVALNTLQSRPLRHNIFQLALTNPARNPVHRTYLRHNQQRSQHCDSDV